ncbi:MAG: hypothetical protein QW356_06020 [Candidatus Hadarchaeales archaeon]
MRVTLRRLNHIQGGLCPQCISVEVSLLVASGVAGTREDFRRAGLEEWWLKQVDRFLRRVERKVERGQKPLLSSSLFIYLY